MRLTTVTNVSLDGVTQGYRRIEVGTSDGSGPNGFEHVAWDPSLLDDAASTYISGGLRARAVRQCHLRAEGLQQPADHRL